MEANEATAKDIADHNRKQLEGRNADSRLHSGVEETRNDRLVRKAKEGGVPYIVFWAPDLLSTLVIKHYQKLVDDYQGDDPALAEAVAHKIHDFIDWQRANPDKVKLPD